MIRNLLLAAAVAGTSCLAAACSAPTPASSSAAGPAAHPAAPAPVTPAVLEHGKGIYKANCAACHGEGGKGDGPAAGVMKPPPRDHTDRAYMSTLSDDDLKKVIQMGGALKGKPLMPSNPQIRGADLEALVAYTRSLSAGSSGPDAGARPQGGSQ
jgi:mono/diheme cytochrome c family protein